MGVKLFAGRFFLLVSKGADKQEHICRLLQDDRVRCCGSRDMAQSTGCCSHLAPLSLPDCSDALHKCCIIPGVLCCNCLTTAATAAGFLAAVCCCRCW